MLSLTRSVKNSCFGVSRVFRFHRLGQLGIFRNSVRVMRFSHRVCSGFDRGWLNMAPGLRKCVFGLNSFSELNRASHLNAVVTCLYLSENLTFFACYVNIYFFSGTVQWKRVLETRNGQLSLSLFTLVIKNWPPFLLLRVPNLFT